jgi:RHS repeat-associated protein
MVRILDAQGNTVVKYAYDPWGVPTIEGDKDLAALNPCSYRGYYYDEETGYYYLQSRYYDPQIGRFMNADSTDFLGISTAALSSNLFIYCENNPIYNVDENGFISFNRIMAIISDLFNSVLQAALKELSNLFVLKKGYLEIKNTIIAAAIDGTIMLFCAAGALLAKVAIKTIVRDFLLKRSIASNKFIRCLIDLLLKPGVMGVIMASLGYVFKWSKYKISAFTSDIVQNLLNAKTKLLGKVYAIYSAISSVGSFIAFCFDILDGNPNGYLRIKFA